MSKIKIMINKIESSYIYPNMLGKYLDRYDRTTKWLSDQAMIPIEYINAYISGVKKPIYRNRLLICKILNNSIFNATNGRVKTKIIPLDIWPHDISKGKNNIYMYLNILKLEVFETSDLIGIHKHTLLAWAESTEPMSANAVMEVIEFFSHRMKSRVKYRDIWPDAIFDYDNLPRKRTNNLSRWILKCGISRARFAESIGLTKSELLAVCDAQSVDCMVTKNLMAGRISELLGYRVSQSVIFGDMK